MLLGRMVSTGVVPSGTYAVDKDASLVGFTCVGRSDCLAELRVLTPLAFGGVALRM